MSVAPLSQTRDFVAEAPAMIAVLRRMEWYARARTPVMLVGAPGTGKTTVAGLVHALSARRGPLVSCSALELDPELERSQLFGHEVGAFTGARTRHIGLFEEAAGGTLLLDDFHHLRQTTQKVLLRVLDTGGFRRLGASRDLPLDARLVVGLTVDPDFLARRGRLLPELRSRLGYSVIRLPRLEERREDIPHLSQCLLDRCPAETGRPGPTRIAPDVLAVFQRARWPFNVRGLRMTIREGYLRAAEDAVLGLKHVCDLVAWPERFEARGSASRNTRVIAHALAATGGDAEAAAALVRASRSTVYNYRRTADRPSNSRVPAGELDRSA
jgi:DNA-binding NtrC family response regulator